MIKTIPVHEKNWYARLDKFLRKGMDEIKLTAIYSLIRKGEVKVNTKRVKKPDYLLQIGDIVEVYLPDREDGKVRITRDLSDKRKLIPRSINLPRIYEDEAIIVLDKPSGLAIHPGEGVHQKTTIIEGLLFEAKEKGYEPYLVHRLDKDTSGLLVIAKSIDAARILGESFRNRNTEKRYFALVGGTVSREETIDDPLDGKEARTQLAPLSVYKREDRSLTLLDVEIFTGRKHQIRRHLSLREHPVLGDTVYGNPEFNRWARGNGLKRLFLQSHDLLFPHPITGEAVRFSLPLNNELQAFVQACQIIEPPTL